MYARSMFRWIRSVNREHRYLVYIPHHIKLPDGRTAWRLVFLDATETTGRFVGGLDTTADGRPVFELVDTLHDVDFPAKAWWTLDRVKGLPLFAAEPSPSESVYFPRPLPEGAKKHDYLQYEPGAWVSYVRTDGSDELARVHRVLRNPGAEVSRPLYVILCTARMQVVTVYHEYLREPRIDCQVVPDLSECWWNRQAVLHEDMVYFPSPGGGFKARDIVSVFEEGGTVGRCARVVRSWVVDGGLFYNVRAFIPLGFRTRAQPVFFSQVEYPAPDNECRRLATVVKKELVRGPCCDWNLESYTYNSPVHFFSVCACGLTPSCSCTGGRTTRPSAARPNGSAPTSCKSRSSISGRPR